MSAIFGAAKKMKQAQFQAESITNETATIRSRPSQQNVEQHPFNIDEIFQADVDRFGQLKDVIKYILDQLERSNKQIYTVETQMKTKMMQVDKNKEASEKNSQEIDRINGVLRALEDKSVECENQLSDHLSNIESIRMNSNLANGRAKQMKETLDEHQVMLDQLMAQANDVPVIDGDGGIDPNQLNKLYASRSTMDDLLERIGVLEKGQNHHTNQIEDIYDKLGGLQYQGSDYSRQINQLKEDVAMILDQLNKGGHVKVAPQQPAQVKDSSQDVQRLNEQVFALRNELNLKLDVRAHDDFRRDLKQTELDRINRIIEELRQQGFTVQKNQEDLKKDFDQLSQFVDMLQKTINTLRNQPSQAAPVPQSNIDENLIRQMLERIANLENELLALKDEFANWSKQLMDDLRLKADIETVKALEQSLMDRLNEIVKQLSKQFADKNDTRKALKLLEKNLKNMYDLFMSKQGHDNEDDAMFTKKPLGGTSCASCAKDVIDLYGKQVQYMPWGKLPFRDPSERIARVGQGFSKMLSMINPEQLSRYDQNMGAMNQGSQENIMTNYQNEEIPTHGKMMMKAGGGGLPPNGKNTASGFNKPYKGGMMMDPNRPSSAQIKQTRPFTRGASKSRKGNYQ